MSRRNIFHFWKLILVITVGINCQEWNRWIKPPGESTESQPDDSSFRKAFIEIKPGLFQLDLILANRLKLQRIINNDDRPRWPENRRTSLSQEEAEQEATTKSITDKKVDNLNVSNPGKTQATDSNKTVIDAITTIHPLLALDRNKTIPHYEVTTENEDLLTNQISGSHNNTIVPKK